MKLKTPLMALFLALATAIWAQQPQSKDQELTVSDLVVQQVLEPLETGVQTQNIQMILGVFDKHDFAGYSNLQSNLRAFFQVFNQADLRYRLLQVTAENGHGSAAVEMQMDALPYEVTYIPVRRSVQMHLQLKQGPKGWKIADFTPADFFNVDYTPK